MREPAFEHAARAVVLVHAVLAMVLAAAVLLQLVLVVRALRGRRQPESERFWSAVVVCTYAATLALGALAHPTYRYFVRALYFDRHAVWASNLFDMKELFATIGLPLAIGTACLSRVLDEEDRALRLGQLMAIAFTAGIVWFDVGSGLLLSLMKSL